MNGELYSLRVCSALERMAAALDRINPPPEIAPEPENPLLSLEKDHLDLSVRAYNSMDNRGIKTIRQLVDLDSKSIMRTKNAGRRTLEEIRSKLAEHGLYLRGEEPAV